MPDNPKIIVKTVREGGSGGEAEILIQARNYFPGRGGAIISKQLVAAALRLDYGALLGTGDRLFFKHLILKKLDDYFNRIGVYDYPHIPCPLGSVNSVSGEREAYLYEWVDGADGFTWVESAGNGINQPLILEEWSQFVGAFSQAGVMMNSDVADPDNSAISQNIVHQFNYPCDLILNPFWKRIDFGSRSLIVDYDKLEKFLIEEELKLKKVLREERYEMIRLAARFIKPAALVSLVEVKRLDSLARKFRMSTLRHRRPGLVIQ